MFHAPQLAGFVDGPRAMEDLEKPGVEGIGTSPYPQFIRTRFLEGDIPGTFRRYPACPGQPSQCS